MICENANTLAHVGTHMVVLARKLGGFDAFEKMKRIFSIASVENLEKSRTGCWPWRRRTLAQRPVYSRFLTQVESVRRTVR